MGAAAVVAEPSLTVSALPDGRIALDVQLVDTAHPHRVTLDRDEAARLAAALGRAVARAEAWAAAARLQGGGRG
jgi:ABC-type nitrate/sulfonate/bicarbonate transport system substrate-binding protein